MKPSLVEGPKLIQFMKDCVVPKLKFDLHKGQCGRIGVVGGSEMYTGAPYYSSITSLKAGADLSYIFCHPSGAISIKSYSPEFIVLPCLVADSDNKSEDDMKNHLRTLAVPWMKRLHVLLVGPGLSKDLMMLQSAKFLIEEACKANIGLVIDADALVLLGLYPALLKGLSFTILTPNFSEFTALCKENAIAETSPLVMQMELGRILGDNVGIIQKGATDLITFDDIFTEGKHMGGPRRCGGQGDMLAGTLATFLGWALKNKFDSSFQRKFSMLSVMYSASCLIRSVSNVTFSEMGRAMTTPDMIMNLGKEFQHMFES